ncbi:HSMGG motif [Cryptosporidium sp. chipmunk genotype I]|uniref:HSMGG motif n=1 Tax=Cryptosporidium sp. chipmunk genotype I TaxID=1280935 RepID=UPI003519F00B|nr:HSMGG motif [Cryptosporidium sp. chipmunk genotype I]
MQFLNGEIKKICAINITRKIFILEKKLRYTDNDEHISGMVLEKYNETVKALKNKRNSNILYPYKNEFWRTLTRNTDGIDRVFFHKLKALSNFCFIEEEIIFENTQLTNYIWKTIGVNPSQKIDMSELMDIFIKKSERRKYLEKLKYIERNLQIENKYKLIIDKLFGKLIKYLKLDANIQDKKFDFFDLIIMECPSIKYFKKILFNDIKSPKFVSLAECLYNRLMEILNLYDNELSTITYKIAKISFISEHLFKKWSKELTELNVHSNLMENFQFSNEKRVDNAQKDLLDLIIIYGYLIRNKLKNKLFKDEEISIILSKISRLLKKANHSLISNQIKLLIELIILQLSEESIHSYEVKLCLLKLVNKIVGNSYNDLLITLIISNILKNYECKVPNKENILHEELISTINKYFFQEKLINDNKPLESGIKILINYIDIENLELLLKKSLINSNMIKNIIELIFIKIQSQILSNINTWKENHFEFNQINFELLNQIINTHKDKNFNINYLENLIVLNFIKTMKILEDKKTIKENKFIKFNIEPSKVNLVKLISMINSKFDQYYESRHEEHNLIKIINCYSFTKIIENILKENLSKDSCNWTLIHEGIKFLNNYLLIAFNSNSLENTTEIYEFSKSTMNEIKKRFINENSNEIELKWSIPQSNIYFELLRLIHNASYISNFKTKENTDINSIQLLNQGIVPFKLNIKEDNQDFLFSKIKEYFNNKNNEKILIKPNNKNINLIFIHGFLGSAFKSWNIDISKESKTPIIVDDNFQSNIIPEYKKKKSNIKLGQKKNCNIISKLEKHNYLIWPRILLTENKSLKMFAVDYSHQIFNQNQSITLKGISEEIYKKLLKANILPKDIENHKEKNNIIICHSMGGILLKLIISNHPEIIKSIKGIIFFGTPHFGTNLHSNIIKILRKKVSSYIIELSSQFNIKKLKKLNSKFQKLIYSIPKQERPLIYSFSEYLPCKIPLLFNISKIIVPHFNSNPFIGNFFILKTDHNLINKLTIYKNDIRYLLIQNLIDL